MKLREDKKCGQIPGKKSINETETEDENWKKRMR